MRPGAIIQARLGSTRLPGKVLAELAGEPLLARVIERVRAARSLAFVGVATTDHPRDDPLVAFCRARGVPVHRGSEDDVLARYVAAALRWKLDPVVRITGDCPFVCPQAIDRLVEALVRKRADAVEFEIETIHEGIDVFSLRWLCRLHAMALPPEEREHLALAARRRAAGARIARIPAPQRLRARPGLRLSVDEPADLAFARKLYAALLARPSHGRAPRALPFGTDDLLEQLDRHPEWIAINAHVRRRVPKGGKEATGGALVEATARGAAGN